MANAARWFAKAASLGLSDSEFNLAVLYERGDGVPQSLVDAFKWYSIAATAGDVESKARVGVLLTQLNDADKAIAAKRSKPSIPCRSTTAPMCRRKPISCRQPDRISLTDIRLTGAACFHLR